MLQELQAVRGYAEKFIDKYRAFMYNIIRLSKIDKFLISKG